MVAMKAPICNFCLTSTILCASDQAKLDSGKISQLDIDVSRALFKIEKKHRAIALSKVLGTKAINGIVVVLIDTQVPIGLGEVLMINRDISRILSYDVKIVERNAATTKVLQELLLPTKVAAVSNVWLPDGSRFIKVKLDGESNIDEVKVYINKLHDFIKEILGVEIFLES